MDYLELLEQQKVWRSNGDVIKLKKMSRPHRLHLLAWLERNAQRFTDPLQVRNFRALGLVQGHVSEGVEWALDSFAAEAEAAAADPVRWMRQRPLYRRLAELVIRDLQQIP